MTEIAVASPREPDGAPRILNLDVLRGIAILGILFMNINDMGQAMIASFTDVRHLGWTSADQVAWWIREIFANGTTRALLEMLFGAGMVILTDRAAGGADNLAVMGHYYFRNFILYLIGLAHLFVFLWPGDILHTYAVASLIAFLFRRWRPRWLLCVGLLFATLQLAFGGYFGVYRGYQQQAQIAAVEARQAIGQPLSGADRALLATVAKDNVQRAKHRAENAADIRQEDQGRSATTTAWVRTQASNSFERSLTPQEFGPILEALATMLIGAALFKLGILQGARTRAFYVRMTLIGYAIGIGLRAIGAYQLTRFDHAPQLNWAFSEYARLATTLGHVGLVTLLLTGAGAWLVKPFAAAGRTALSLYILQSIVTLWVLFPPFGFALYGHFGWAKLMLIALALDIVLMGLAVWWMREFRMGPVEWAWRSIIERRSLPFRRRSSSVGEAAPSLA